MITSSWVADCFLVYFSYPGLWAKDVGESGFEENLAHGNTAGYSGVLEGL